MLAVDWVRWLARVNGIELALNYNFVMRIITHVDY